MDTKVKVNNRCIDYASAYPKRTFMLKFEISQSYLKLDQIYLMLILKKCIYLFKILTIICIESEISIFTNTTVQPLVLLNTDEYSTRIALIYQFYENELKKLI